MKPALASMVRVQVVMILATRQSLVTPVAFLVVAAVATDQGRAAVMALVMALAKASQPPENLILTPVKVSEKLVFLDSI
ncbi:hypothetical protein BVY11_21010 [Pseudomonas amygdali pv. morsprunorum]|nr:hypothetical protein BVY11_21010 [Pseudomonas amygdali pv. morsprunorum]PPS33192.1 hypothetical protein BVY12_16710 [Pseudomonas amygdali pv. morsprunorum]